MEGEGSGGGEEAFEDWDLDEEDAAGSSAGDGEAGGEFGVAAAEGEEAGFGDAVGEGYVLGSGGAGALGEDSRRARGALPRGSGERGAGSGKSAGGGGGAPDVGEDAGVLDLNGGHGRGGGGRRI
jgi:hypothetical protein